MKNCEVAESRTLVRAMARAYMSFFSPLVDSFLIGGCVGFSRYSLVKPPPWIMKVSITRWKTVPL